MTLILYIIYNQGSVIASGSVRASRAKYPAKAMVKGGAEPALPRACMAQSFTMKKVANPSTFSQSFCAPTIRISFCPLTSDLSAYGMFYPVGYLDMAELLHLPTYFRKGALSMHSTETIDPLNWNTLEPRFTTLLKEELTSQLIPS